MTGLRDFIRTFWPAPDELLAADLWRMAILATALFACVVVAILERKSPSPWMVAKVGAIVLIALASAVRPGTIVATGLIAAALVIGIVSLGVARSSTKTARIVLTVLLAGLALATAGFHLFWSVSASQRAIALEEMRRRPADPWPRGTGHATLGGFATPAEQRGWLEAGGSFSPTLRSFGISIWAIDAAGNIIATSDSIPLGDTRHTYHPDGPPAVAIDTPFYAATWTLDEHGNYTLDLTGKEATVLELVVRSVGPAGGPLHKIELTENGLTLNDEWTLALPTDAATICLGDERHTSLMTACAHGGTVGSPDGWAFARIKLGEAPTHLTLVSTASGAPIAAAGPPAIALTGFPASFSDRLAAQAATLLGGIVENETRPGDPINYPLSWQRDGAYMLVALARAGYAAQIQHVAEKFAADDFFGGFGAEADAPGLSLWALGEVSAALRDPGFDAAIWSDVERKAGLIDAMQSAESELRFPYSGPIVPRGRERDDLDLVAGPADGGLIMGRMDWQWPVFFINAVSYLGLTEAATLADRLGRREQATRWTDLAATIRTAYRERMASLSPDASEVANPRTAISALWPADVADQEAFADALEPRWASSPAAATGAGRPPWTYFALAEAHQWLRLGRVDRVLATLDWFDRNDLVPGLQVFWEGDGEENSFGGWRDVRGNLLPQGVTPHYWTSAEGLLLSIEMLAYVDSGKTRLTVGGGLPAEWLATPLSAHAVGTSIGPISWDWNGRNCIATDAPPGVTVAAGPNFPAGTVIARAPAACPA